MEALELIYRIQAMRLRGLRYASLDQLQDAAPDLYRKALEVEGAFWFYFRDWYEVHGRPDDDRELLDCADRAYHVWVEVCEVMHNIYCKELPFLRKPFVIKREAMELSRNAMNEFEQRWGFEALHKIDSQLWDALLEQKVMLDEACGPAGGVADAILHRDAMMRGWQAANRRMEDEQVDRALAVFPDAVVRIREKRPPDVD